MLTAEKTTRRGKTGETERPTRTAGPPIYVMVQREVAAFEPLRVAVGSRGEALVVFTSKRNARRYLSLGDLGVGWRTRESSRGEIVSMLLSLCKGVGYVLLDPLPGDARARNGSPPTLVDTGKFISSCLRVAGG